MDMEFNPSWIVCVDERMITFYNDHAPGWISLNKNPHPLWNECHTIVSCETKIIFRMELVEGKYNPKEGMHATQEF